MKSPRFPGFHRSAWDCASTRILQRRERRPNCRAPRSNKTFVNMPGLRWMWWKSSCLVRETHLQVTHIWLKHRHLGSKVKRLCLVCALGTAESGKSTLIKQIKIMHSHGFSKQELISFKVLVIQCSASLLTRPWDDRLTFFSLVACSFGQPPDLYEVCTAGNGDAEDKPC